MQHLHGAIGAEPVCRKPLGCSIKLTDARGYKFYNEKVSLVRGFNREWEKVPG